MLLVCNAVVVSVWRVKMLCWEKAYYCEIFDICFLHNFHILIINKRYTGIVVYLGCFMHAYHVLV